MYRVDLPRCPHPLFFVRDPREDSRFDQIALQITWEIVPESDKVQGSVVPAVVRKGQKTQEAYEGLIGRNHSNPGHYRQTNNQRYLSGYEMVHSPMILESWSHWLEIAPTIEMTEQF